MSIRIMAHVWRLDLPAHQKYLALALADHAHDDGTEARPSQAHLAEKTGLSERQVRRLLAELLEARVIVRVRPGGRNRATSYAFVLEDADGLLSDLQRRTRTIQRRTPTSGIADADDRLTVNNRHKNLNGISSNNVPASPETKAAAIAAARAALRGRSPSE